MNNHMVYQFDRLTERITYSFEAEEMDTELREFDNFITLQLNVLAKEVLYFTDPSIAKTNEAIIDLLSYCRGSNGIVKMAEDHFNITTWNAHQKKLKKKIINAVYSMPAYKTIQILEDIELIINGKIYYYNNF
uniref:Uncharacterized protein n=1 Tax=Meloidogyne enterolobii TaxID=390850 RepID=A0A6V7UCX9_MELEN|nr:unnamed protein product [Meloidogyne enterolobii]